MTDFLDSMLSDCRLCPRNCGADRLAGDTGYCGAGRDVTLARAALHYWEEPCISGSEGSGTVFFSYCNLGCIFCQNREISHEGRGKAVSIDRLAEIFLELQEKGANNINLVTAVHYVPQVIAALDRARRQGLSIPVLYNSGGYEAVSTIEMLGDYVDLWLPDLKYVTPEIAASMSGARDYPEAAVSAIGKMLQLRRVAAFDERGMMTRGVIIRHMVLPGHTRESMAVLRYIAEHFGTDTYISLLSQYTPMPGLSDIPGLDKNLLRRVTAREYDKVVDAAIDLGFTNAFIQERRAATGAFIPYFSGEGV